MSPSPPELLRHILDEIDYLLAQSQQVSREGFLRQLQEVVDSVDEA